MKKFILPLAAILLSLLVLVGVLVYLFIALPKLNSAADGSVQIEQSSVGDYIAAAWPDYRFESLTDGVLTLEYDLNVPFSQVQKYGPQAGYDALAAGHADTAALMIHGCMIQCGVQIEEIVVRGMSSDGQEAYRSSNRSGVTACWDTE